MLYSLSFCCSTMIVLSSILLPISLFADKGKTFDDKALQASAIVSQGWLALVDKNQYAQSWEACSSITKLTVSKDQWIQILNKVRKPLGGVSSREVMEQRVAKDPNGLPKGDYMVMFYKTTFHQKQAYELVTLYFEENQWRVLTYQVSSIEKS